VPSGTSPGPPERQSFAGRMPVSTGYVGKIGASNGFDARSNALMDPARPDPRLRPASQGAPSPSSSAPRHSWSCKPCRAPRSEPEAARVRAEGCLVWRARLGYDPRLSRCREWWAPVETPRSTQERVWPVAVVGKVAARSVERSAGCAAGSVTARNSGGRFPPSTRRGTGLPRSSSTRLAQAQGRFRRVAPDRKRPRFVHACLHARRAPAGPGCPPPEPRRWRAPRRQGLATGCRAEAAPHHHRGGGRAGAKIFMIANRSTCWVKTTEAAARPRPVDRLREGGRPCE